MINNNIINTLFNKSCKHSCFTIWVQLKKYDLKLVLKINCIKLVYLTTSKLKEY